MNKENVFKKLSKFSKKDLDNFEKCLVENNYGHSCDNIQVCDQIYSELFEPKANLEPTEFKDNIKDVLTNLALFRMIEVE